MTSTSRFIFLIAGVESTSLTTSSTSSSAMNGVGEGDDEDAEVDADSGRYLMSPGKAMPTCLAAREMHAAAIDPGG